MIVEDQRLVAEGLKLLLNGVPDIDVVGTVESKAGPLKRWPVFDANVALMDFLLPDWSGVEAAAPSGLTARTRSPCSILADAPAA